MLPGIFSKCLKDTLRKIFWNTNDIKPGKLRCNVIRKKLNQLLRNNKDKLGTMKKSGGQSDWNTETRIKEHRKSLSNKKCTIYSSLNNGKYGNPMILISFLLY